MRFRLRFAATAVCAAALCSMASPQRGGSQLPPDSQVQQEPPEDAKLPNGKSQRDEILKAERKQNLKDAADLVALTQQLQQDFEKNESYVFSINTLKKTDDIEKLVKKIRSRMLHN
jgi:hypothetical protein